MIFQPRGRRGKISGIIIAVLSAFVAVSVYAATDLKDAGDVSRFNIWLAQDKATGDWNGFRNSLNNSGLGISSSYTIDVGGNPTGGLKQTVAYSACLYMAANLDFEKMASIKGLALKVSNLLLSGQNLSTSTGSFYSVQEIYAPGSYYFGELNLSLSILDDTFLFEMGRIFAGDIFAVPTFSQYYLNSSANGPGTIESDVFFPHYNTAVWGVRATYQPNDDWYLMTGLYDANQSAAKITNYGADFSFDMDEGYLAVSQLTYVHGQDRKRGALPGSASFGAYYENSRFKNFSDLSNRRHGNYGFYLMADQTVYLGERLEFGGAPNMGSGATPAESHAHPRYQSTIMPQRRPKELGLWGGAVLAPQENINAQTYEIAVGAVYYGLLPKRDRDATAFCFVLGHFSPELEGQSDEMILELDHRFQMGPWFYITPDIQYIINPNGKSDIADALVLGFEASFDF